MAGLDLASFVECFHSTRHADEVHRLSKVARKLGVTGTPTSLVNGKVIEGLVDLRNITSRLRVKFVP